MLYNLYYVKYKMSKERSPWFGAPLNNSPPTPLSVPLRD
ncbi:hypothetical protein C900_01320 [Fulvivirga imtechensis AK7]|uniref:Uncharacterized protein n=1 Tax=Fulvivirga imtechensis AK7 TaxID=1237149 RepID=L8JZB8_9BACT|nr:hypothetical protein C900_01320 [Fulvivirga imtechensis AK7]